MPILITSGGRLGTLLYHTLKSDHDLRVLRRRPDPAFGPACIIGDVSRYDDVARAMEGCEIVLHTAVRNNTDVELQSYEQFLGANIDGAFNICLAAVRQGVGRLVHCSSCVAVMSGPAPAERARRQGAAVRIDDAAEHTRSDIYGLTKVVGEHITDYFHAVHDLSVVALRFGWLAPLAMYRDPTMIYNTLRLCFHEQDAVAATLAAMHSSVVGNYLITAPTRFTDADGPALLDNTAEVVGRHYPAELAYLESLGFKPTPIPVYPDCSRATADLGYRPQFDFPAFVELHRQGAFGEEAGG